MLNKKGIGSEIDWILGAGLFFLSITFIFVLFRPGIMPIHDSHTLLNIVQDGFEDNVNWEVIRVPIFLAPIYQEYVDLDQEVRLSDSGYDVSGSDSGNNVVPENNYYDQLFNLINEKEEENMKIFYVALVDESPGRETNDQDIEAYCESDPSTTLTEEERSRRGDLIERWETFCNDPTRQSDREAVGEARRELQSYSPSIIPPGLEPISSERENQLDFNKINENELIFPTSLGQEKTKYVLTVSDKPINFVISEDISTGSYMGCYAYDGDFTGSLGQVIETRDPPFDPTTECSILYELGTKEKLTGIHYPTLFGLEDFTIDISDCTRGYGCLKKAWNFPEAKEFMIEVESIPEGTVGTVSCDPTTGQLCYKFPAKSIGPQQNINVFVRQFNRFILTDDGEKIPIIVRLTVW